MQQGDYFLAPPSDSAEFFVPPSHDEIVEFHKAEKRRNKELKHWLDEFMMSPEFAAHFNRVLYVNHRATSVTSAMLDEYYNQTIMPITEMPETPNVTFKAKKNLYERLQRALICSQIENTIQNQLKGIRVIRQKIHDYKESYMWNKAYKRQCRLDERLTAMEYIKAKYNIAVTSQDNRKELVDAVLDEQKRRREQAQRTKANKEEIVSKLVNEMKRQRQIDAWANKKYDYRVKSCVRMVRDLEVIGVAKPLHERTTEQKDKATGPDPLVEVFTQKPSKMGRASKISKFSLRRALRRSDRRRRRGSLISALKMRRSRRSLRSLRSMRSFRSRRSIRSLRSLRSLRSMRSRSSRKSRRSRRSLRRRRSHRSIRSLRTRFLDSRSSSRSRRRRRYHYNLPEPEIENPRTILRSRKDNVNVLLQEIDNLNNYLLDREEYELERFLEDNAMFNYDHDIVPNPNKLEFKDFECGQSYTKQLNIINKGEAAKKVRFERIVWNADIQDELLMEVEPIGVQRITPGMTLTVQLRFNPETLSKTTEAKLIFLTYYPGHEEYKQFNIHILCLPLCADIRIIPTIISFKEMPIWRARVIKEKRKNFKYITIKNSGLKECRVVITRQFTPITLEQAWRNIISILSIDEEMKAIKSKEIDDEAKVEFPRNLVQDCIETMFNTFRFERNIFDLHGHSEERIKVWFKNMDCEGYNVETYTFSVYERYRDNKLYCIGTQDVIINAETTGHFLKLIPNMIDFEVCVYDSVYQTQFEISNPSSIAHIVHIRFPRLMSTYLDASMRDLIIHPGHEVKIGVKFIPRRDIIDNCRKYYDPDTCMFEFPIYIQVKTKNYEDTPPIELDVFAAVTESEAMLIAPCDMSIVSLYKNDYLFDMGICHTMETVYVDFNLTNQSLSPQHYAFLNLPKWILIQPNFGFGHLLPMETIKLRLYVSFSRYDLDNIYDDANELYHNFSFFVKCTTVKKLGGLKRRMNKKRVLRKLKKMEAIVSKSIPDRTPYDLIHDMDYLIKLLISEKRSAEVRLTIPDLPYTLSQIFSIYGSEEKLLQIISLDLPSSASLGANKQSKNEFHTNVTLADPETSATATVLESTILVPREESVEGEEKETFVVPISKTTCGFWIQAQLQDLLCDASHQYINFPLTPCGSYTIMNISLNARKYIRLKHKRRVNSSFKAHFQIFGDSSQICAEPLIGEVSTSGKIQLYLVARPEVPKYLIEERIRVTRREQEFARRRQKVEISRFSYGSSRRGRRTSFASHRSGKGRRSLISNYSRRSRRSQRTLRTSMRMSRSSSKSRSRRSIMSSRSRKSSRSRRSGRSRMSTLTRMSSRSRRSMRSRRSLRSGRSGKSSRSRMSRMSHMSHKSRKSKKSGKSKKSLLARQSLVSRRSHLSRKKSVSMTKSSTGRRKSRMSNAQLMELKESLRREVIGELGDDSVEDILATMTIRKKEPEFNYLEYYPAEMLIWQNLEPYNIEANFRCQITYTNKHLKMYSETIYLRANCRVIRPDFIHNLTLQELDFGLIPIGMSSTQTLRLQNITRHDISPKISIVSPIDGFYVPELFGVEVPSEYYLHIPITFRPNKEGESCQLVEVTSNATCYPFIFRGVGLTPEFNFRPDFKVVHMQVNRNRTCECTFDIYNDCPADVQIRIDKILEIEGNITRKEYATLRGVESASTVKLVGFGGLWGNSRSGSGQRINFTNALWRVEYLAMQNRKFTKRDSRDQLFSVDDEFETTYFAIPPFGRQRISLEFGRRPGWRRRKGRVASADVKADSKKGGKSSITKLYIAKFNIMLGANTFIKDFIATGIFK